MNLEVNSKDEVNERSVIFNDESVGGRELPRKGDDR